MHQENRSRYESTPPGQRVDAVPAGLFQSLFSNATDLATRGATGSLVGARQPLWAWLVDCLQPGDLEPAVGETAANHVLSKTWRVPNQINGLEINKTD
jgi:hypothetical protein